MITSTDKINKVIVTGASGYIASYIIQELLLDESIGSIVGVVRDSNNEKNQFLKKLKGAESKLTLESGDLESADYDSIFNDADAILHIASPYVYTAENPELDIVQPAINGNLRVLNAALKHSDTIKKVIITSSTAAITDLKKKKSVYDESDWNDSTTIATPYSYSKYLAEKATWDFKKNQEANGINVPFEIIVINPAFVLGPPVEGYPSLNTSLATFRNSLTGVPETRFVGLIDVRDVVAAHINALKSKVNFDHTRYLMADTVASFAKMGEIVKLLFPQYEITPCQIDPSIPHHEYSLTSISPQKSTKPYIKIETTLKDCVDYLIKNNHYNPKLKQQQL